MSLILDALRKADQERQALQQTPGLDTQHDLPQASSNRVLLAWLLVLGTALLIALLAWLWPASVEENQIQSTTEIVQSSTEPAPSLIPEAGTLAIDESSPALLPEPESAADKQGDAAQIESSSRRFDTHYQGVAQKTDMPRVQNEAIEQLYQQPLAEEEPVAPVVESPVQPAIGGVRDLPQSVQNRIPTLMYSAHFFEQTEAPSVIINGQRLHKGSTISGMTVEDIMADGVVLRLDNHNFKLNALSSWVNM